MLGDIIIANVIASACLVLVIYFLDINEKEPPWTLVRIYVFSILMTFLYGKLKTILFSHYQWEFSPLFSNFVIAGFFEELLKLIVVLIFVWPLKSFNEETDGIIYYLVVAAGFTVLENLGYSFQFVLPPYVYGLQTGEMGIYRDALQKIVLLRAVSGHIFVNVVSGVFLGIARRRHKWWLLIPGFAVSVFLHGTWNQTALRGSFWYYAFLLLVIDAVLFAWLIRSSFYFKFMKRLKYRIKSLIAEARKMGIHDDILILMEGIRQHVTALRSMEGDVLTAQAKVITQTLPVKVEGTTTHGPDGLVERLLKINGILSKYSQNTGKWFWIGLFTMFSVTGFFVLLILVSLM